MDEGRHDGLAIVASDDDVREIPARDAVAVMAEAVRAHGAGELSAPPRQTVAVEGGGFILTTGRLPGVAAGFRLYGTVPEVSSEVTLAFRPGGQPLGVVLGAELGRRRTGALGGVAADLCARKEARTVGLVGAGGQAFTQLWAIQAVRDLDEVRVFTRSRERGQTFAARAFSELGLTVTVVATAQAAVTDADIVVLSTPAPTPLIEPTWIAPGTHIHTLGPKGMDEGECPRSLVHSTQLLVSDSPAQLTAMEGESQPWTGGREAVALGAIATGASPGRTGEDDITLYASVGLAGTEVLLAHHLFQGWPTDRAGLPA